MACKQLRTVVVMGSARTQAPPWDANNQRLGTRVLKYVEAELSKRNSDKVPAGTNNGPLVEHDVTVVDPIDVFGPNGALSSSGSHVTAPHFYLKSAPAEMDALRDVFKAADAIIVVTAEYNHCVPPALLSILDHFGGSNFAAKPSAIVSYSGGPWGGAHAGIAIQPVLHELGALPVSKMVHLPSVGELLAADGTPVDPQHRMLKQFPALLNQLEWMAVAMKNHRDAFGMWA